jgi:hypothetical protein
LKVFSTTKQNYDVVLKNLCPSLLAVKCEVFSDIKGIIVTIASAKDQFYKECLLNIHKEKTAKLMVSIQVDKEF